MLTPEAGLCVGLGCELGQVDRRVDHLRALGQAGQKAGVSIEGFQVKVPSERKVTGASQRGLRERE